MDLWIKATYTELENVFIQDLWNCYEYFPEQSRSLKAATSFIEIEMYVIYVRMVCRQMSNAEGRDFLEM